VSRHPSSRSTQTRACPSRRVQVRAPARRGPGRRRSRCIRKGRAVAAGSHRPPATALVATTSRTAGPGPVLVDRETTSLAVRRGAVPGEGDELSGGTFPSRDRHVAKRQLTAPGPGLEDRQHRRRSADPGGGGACRPASTGRLGTRLNRSADRWPSSWAPGGTSGGGGADARHMKRRRKVASHAKKNGGPRKIRTKAEAGGWRRARRGSEEPGRTLLSTAVGAEVPPDRKNAAGSGAALAGRYRRFVVSHSESKRLRWRVHSSPSRLRPGQEARVGRSAPSDRVSSRRRSACRGVGGHGTSDAAAMQKDSPR